MYANQQLKAYSNTQKQTMSGRDIEAEVLSQAALKLKICQQNWNNADRDEKLDEALKYNQLVWSVFQSELAKKDNPLPVKLRADILSLSAFIDKRILEVMAYPSPEKLNVIININNNIASGLRS